LLTLLLLSGITLLEWRTLVPTLRLILETLGLLVTIPLTNWSQEPLLMALMGTETLTVVAPRTLCQHPSLPILTLPHIIKHNGTIHKSLEGRIGVSSQLQPELVVETFHE